MSRDRTQELADKLAKEFTDKGLLIEAGWRTMELYVLPKDASTVQRQETRKAFFMGAQHLYASIMGIMDADREPTAKDMERMTLIHNELEAFRMDVTNVHTPGRG
jgi:hypothetical protein